MGDLYDEFDRDHEGIERHDGDVFVLPGDYPVHDLPDIGVSLPEEMSVREVLEFDRGIRDALGHGLDLIVVNGVQPDRFTDQEAGQLQELASRSRAPGALRAALWSHRRARRHAGYVRWLRSRAQAPVITLPFIFSSTIGRAEYETLADDLKSRSASSASSLSRAV